MQDNAMKHTRYLWDIDDDTPQIIACCRLPYQRGMVVRHRQDTLALLVSSRGAWGCHGITMTGGMRWTGSARSLEREVEECVQFQCQQQCYPHFQSRGTLTSYSGVVSALFYLFPIGCSDLRSIIAPFQTQEICSAKLRFAAAFLIGDEAAMKCTLTSLHLALVAVLRFTVYPILWWMNAPFFSLSFVVSAQIKVQTALSPKPVTQQVSILKEYVRHVISRDNSGVIQG